MHGEEHFFLMGSQDIPKGIETDANGKILRIPFPIGDNDMYACWIFVFIGFFLNEAICAAPESAPQEKPKILPEKKIVVFNPRCAFLQGSPNGAIHMHIEAEEGDVLLEASLPSSFAEKVELHTHEEVDGTLKMRKVSRLEVPKEGLDLRPGGDHIMLIGVGSSFKKGVTLPLRLYFEKAGWIEVSVPVQAPHWRRDSRGKICHACSH